MTKPEDPSDEELDRLLAMRSGAAVDGEHPDDGVLLEHARSGLNSEAIEAHLARCADCRGLWLEMKHHANAAPLAEPVKVVGFQPRRAALIAMAAIAAALLVFVLIPQRTLPAMTLDPLPPGLSETRGEANARPIYDREAKLELVVRSDRLWAEWSYGVAVYSRAGKEDPTRVTAVHVSAEGHALRVDVLAGALGAAGTERELMVVVAEDDADFDQLALASNTGSGARIFVERVKIAAE